MNINWNAKGQKGFPNEKSQREKNARIELMFASNHFKCKQMKHYNQSNTVLKIEGTKVEISS